MKIKEEQLNTIRNQQEELHKLLNEIGILEANKHALLHKISDVNKNIDDTKKSLEKEYGAVNINLEDGSYKPIEEEAVEPVTA